jgi:hypothetical protein
MKRDVLGGGQPAGLAAASAQGRRPPKAGGGHIKLTLVSRNSLPQIGIVPFLNGQRDTGGGASPLRGLAPPKKKLYIRKWYNTILRPRLS